MKLKCVNNHSEFDVISEEQMTDSFIEMMSVEAEMESLISEANEASHAFEIYSQIYDTITELGGVDKSLEFMFGENFTDSASMEAEAKAQKDGFFAKMWQWIKDFFAKLWAWFKSWFQTRDGMITKLEELKAKADTLEYPVIVPVYMSAIAKGAIGGMLLDAVQAMNVSPTSEDYVSKLSTFWGRFETNMLKIKASYGFKSIEAAQKNMEVDKTTLIAMIDGYIGGLKVSKEISTSFKSIEEKLKALYEKEDRMFIWLRCKNMLFYIWRENQKYFHNILRLSNLLLQRAKAGNKAPESTPPPPAEPTPPPQNIVEPPKPEEKKEASAPANDNKPAGNDNSSSAPVVDYDDDESAAAYLKRIKEGKELLQFENELLRNELEIASLEHDLELIRTVKDCIIKEGTVTKSVEIMFGENFSSVESALEELESAYNQISNELFDKFFEFSKLLSTVNALEKMIEKAASLKEENFKDVEFPIELPVTSKVVKVGKTAEALKADWEAFVYKVETGSVTKDDIDGFINKAKSTLAEMTADVPEGADIPKIESASELIRVIKEGKHKYEVFKRFARMHQEKAKVVLANVAELLEGNGVTKADFDRYQAEIVRGIRILGKIFMELAKKVLALAK